MDNANGRAPRQRSRPGHGGIDSMSETHVSDLLALARAELRDRWIHYRDEFGPSHDEPHDVIHEIADGCVPVYTSELLQLAAESNGLAIDTPELGPAFDGAPTPANIIAANVFEAIEAELWEEWRQIEAEPLAAIIADASKEGYERGEAAGSWVIDGNTTDEATRRILRGIADGDPAVMDSLPLSGEWADGLLPGDVLAWYDLGGNDDGADDVLTAFEEGFSRGVADEVARAACASLGDDLDED